MNYLIQTIAIYKKENPYYKVVLFLDNAGIHIKKEVI